MVDRAAIRLRDGADGSLGGGTMTSNLAAPEHCLGCPDPIYDDRRGEWDWFCRQWSPTGIKCSNVAVLRERCYRVREYFARKEASK